MTCNNHRKQKMSLFDESTVDTEPNSPSPQRMRLDEFDYTEDGCIDLTQCVSVPTPCDVIGTFLGWRLVMESLPVLEVIRLRAVSKAVKNVAEEVLLQRCNHNGRSLLQALWPLFDKSEICTYGDDDLSVRAIRYMLRDRSAMAVGRGIAEVCGSMPPYNDMILALIDAESARLVTEYFILYAAEHGDLAAILAEARRDINVFNMLTHRNNCMHKVMSQSLVKHLPIFDPKTITSAERDDAAVNALIAYVLRVDLPSRDSGMLVSLVHGCQTIYMPALLEVRSPVYADIVYCNLKNSDLLPNFVHFAVDIESTHRNDSIGRNCTRIVYEILWRANVERSFIQL